VGESSNRKLDYRRRTFRDARQPRAALVEAGDVNREARGVQKANELDHLPLGAAWLEPGQEDGDRNLGGQVHSLQSQQARCHAEGG
jgi:hypothetical protein